jgi:hypothetical protein
MKIDVNNLTKSLRENKSLLIRTDSLKSDMNILHTYYKNSSPNNESIKEYLKNNDSVNVFELARIYLSQFLNEGDEIVIENTDDPNLIKISLKNELT